MSIVESTNSKGTRRTGRVEGLAAGAAVVAAAVFASAPKTAHALDWSQPGDVSYFQAEFWINGTFTGTLPDAATTAVAGFSHLGIQTNQLDAVNASFPALGLTFDPGAASVSDGSGGDSGGIGNSSYYADNGSNANGGTWELFNGSSTLQTNITASYTAFEKLTIKSGTMLANVWSIGRNGPAWLTVNGGEMISNGKIQMSVNGLSGATIEYHGGTILAKNEIQFGGQVTGSSPETTENDAQVWNDGPAGAFEVSNGVLLANAGTNGFGSTSIVEFHYGVDAINGRTRPIQSIGTNANLKIQNSEVDTNQSFPKNRSELNLVLNAAPSIVSGVTQNLGLFHENTITGSGTFPHNFYATNGTTLYSQGATVTASFGGSTYSWTISYSGVITFDVTGGSAASAYDTAGIAAVGGNDVVLIGVAVPEPASAALLGGAGSLILARRRARAKKA